MSNYHNNNILETPAIQALRTISEEWKKSESEQRCFQEYERRVRQATMAVERELLASALTELEVDCEEVIVDGVRFQRVEKPRERTYCALAGEFSTQVNLYRPVNGGKPICPLELRAGIIRGNWTPAAAELMVYSAGLMTPGEAESLLKKFGGFSPSKSSIDRLPKTISKRWEVNRESWEAAIREQEQLPLEAEIVAVSLDGVTVPMKDGRRAQKREVARQQGKQTRGPAGYREAACGTVTTYDSSGMRLETTRFARMPERKKVTLNKQLTAEAKSVLASHPALTLVMMSDGAKDNWRILEEIVGCLEEAGVVSEDTAVHWIADFYHASEHIKKATDLYYGKNSAASYGAHEILRRKLLELDDGVEKVIKKLTYLRNHTKPGKKRDKLTTEVKYFRNRVDRMRYKRFQELGLPIGTGVVEAACKTLVTQRAKRSGMGWSIDGGQAILTPRSLIQSDRWGPAWELLSKSYRTQVHEIGTRKRHLSSVKPSEIPQAS